ncbi:MAG: glycosyltransferase [Candidatus Woesearchaeota archaeon]
MKSVCIITVGNPKKQPRVRKQVNYLINKGYDITIVSNEKGYENLKHYEYKKLSIINNVIRNFIFIKTKRYEQYYWNKDNKKLAKKLSALRFDLIIVHGIRNILLALNISNSAKILLDAHEYYPENFSDNWFWRFTVREYYTYLCKNYLNKVDYVITVAPGIVDLYKNNFGLKNVELITNSAEYFDLKPTLVDKNHIKLIHHGDCSSSRRLELMIEAAKDFNKNIHLYLMLVVSRGYKHYFIKLKKLAENIENIHFIDPVPSEQIVKSINNFDIGLVFVPPTNQNLYFGLGNKFFEFIQARLMTITGPSIEMMKYIDRYQIGKYTKTFEPSELAKLVNSLSAEEINNFKNRTNQVARELSYEVENKDKFQKIINNLLNNLENE